MPISNPNATQDPASSQKLPALLALLAVMGIAFVWLGSVAHAPWNDAGGYENMLRYFLVAGKVDYMQWSQPTFIGILPVAVPWAHLFGTSSASLQSLGILYSLILVAGLYAFFSRHASPWLAALLSASILCFAEMPMLAATFMTDMPYTAYLVWFLVTHQAIEHDTGVSRRRTIILWIAWSILFLLASLTRSFTLILVPVFLAQLIIHRSDRDLFARRCFLLSVALSVLCIATVKLLGIHLISLVNLTVMPEVLRQHDWARIELRTLIVSLLQTSLMLLPAMLLVPSLRRSRLTIPETVAALICLLLAAHFWRKGLLTAVFPMFPNVHASAIISGLQVVLSPFAFVLLLRLLRQALTRTRSSSMLVVVVLTVVHFVALPITQHPVLRHVFPAYIALLMIVSLSGVRSSHAAWVGVAVAVIAACNIVNARAVRRINAAQYQAAARLQQNQVPLQEIDGGWSWFCAQDLHSGTDDPAGYVARYLHLQRTARYAVTLAPLPASASNGSKTILTDSRNSVFVYDRGPQAGHTDAGGSQ